MLSDGDGNPRFHINSSGYFKANPNGARNNSSAIHEIGHDGLDEVLYVEAGNTSYGNSILTVIANRNTTVGTFNAYRYYNDAAATTRFLVEDGGNVYNTTGTYGSTSDQRLKENIVDASSQWDDIKALRVRKYSMIADELEAPDQIGVIAQELEASGMSGLVKEIIDRGRNGEDLGTTTKSVKYSILYMKAVKALQEAMDRIETLEAKVTALENA